MLSHLRLHPGTIVYLLLVLSISLLARSNLHAEEIPSLFATPLAASDLDPASFTQWVDGAETPIDLPRGPGHVLWTRTSQPEWNGVRFGEGKTPGLRHLRLGWKKPVPVGAVLVRGGGLLSVLKQGSAGDLNDNSQWTPAQRIKDGKVGRPEVGAEEFAVWVLPPGVVTRALRFTHDADLTEKSYAGWLGGVFVLTDRMVNIAPAAQIVASARPEAQAKINNESQDNTWDAWDNGKEGAEHVVSPEHPEWILLVWQRPIPLRGLNALWAGFGAAEVFAYTGPAERHPREATEGDWRKLRCFDKLENQYPRALGVNWLDLEQTVTTRALKVKITAGTREAHPHLNGKTHAGKRVWLGELLALMPLGEAGLETALLAAPRIGEQGHPPIPVRFALKEPGLVTLVIEDLAEKRLRNLVSETPFPAGDNIAWWDGLDDLGRDVEAARHGIYHVPGQFVLPGKYKVRGLVRQGIDLHYEFSLYNAGNPAWTTEDNTGGWLTNHTPPRSTLFVPADRSPTGKALVYIGSYVAEGGHGLAWVDLDGRVVGGRGWVGGNWTGAQFLARDAGPYALAGIYAYVGSAWEKELRLTGLSKRGDQAIVKFVFDSKETTKLLAWRRMTASSPAHCLARTNSCSSMRRRGRFSAPRPFRMAGAWPSTSEAGCSSWRANSSSVIPSIPGRPNYPNQKS